MFELKIRGSFPFWIRLVSTKRWALTFSRVRNEPYTCPGKLPYSVVGSLSIDIDLLVSSIQNLFFILACFYIRQVPQRL
jgi:hypothetical protein